MSWIGMIIEKCQVMKEIYSSLYLLAIMDFSLNGDVLGKFTCETFFEMRAYVRGV